MVGNDLTQGKISKAVLKYTAPFLFSNLLYTLYSIVDLFVVGRYADAVELSGVSVGSLLMMTINAIVAGMGTGGTVLVGQLFGAKKEPEMKKSISTIFCIVPIVSAVVTLFLLLFRWPLLKLINTPNESYSACEAYLRYCAYGLIFTGLFNAIASVLRGLGDSKSPTVFITIACIINIVGDVFLVGYCHLGAAGAAIATSFAQGISVVAGFVFLKTHKLPFSIKLKELRIDTIQAKSLFQIGVPAALQEILVNISFIVLEALLNTMGYLIVAASGVDDRLFTVAVIPACSFSASIATIVAQNIGAGKPKRAHSSLAIGCIFSLIIGILVFFAMTFWPAQIIGIFTTDPEVIAYAVDYMFFYRFEYLFCSITFCVNGYLNGTGRTKYTLITNLTSSFLVRLPLVWFFLRQFHDIRIMGLALPLSSFAQMLIGFGFLFFAPDEILYRKKEKLEN